MGHIYLEDLKNSEELIKLLGKMGKFELILLNMGNTHKSLHIKLIQDIPQ
jgi:uncharacterized protein